MNKLKFAMGIFGISFLCLMVACVKDVADQNAQFEAEKAELLKSQS
jgi:hypothetical protein